jgi:D-glycero-D-manno-heptose 1,7-bisphosphate phosphatase
VAEPVRLYVFDADGTLRRTPGKPCPHVEGEWELLPGVRERLGQIPWDSAAGPWLGVASNQDHVGYGLLTAQTCEALLRAMVHEATGGRAEPLVAYCPHVLEVDCGCRKPAPGMLVELMARCGVGPRETLFVGDADRDAGAAERAGVRFAWAWDFFGW